MLKLKNYFFFLNFDLIFLRNSEKDILDKKNLFSFLLIQIIIIFFLKIILILY